MSAVCWKRLLIGALMLASAHLRAESACSTPMWQDEFNGGSVDTTKWQFVEGDGCDEDMCGWGNDEKQWYLAKNARIEAGALHYRAARTQQLALVHISQTDHTGAFCSPVGVSKLA